MQLGAWASGTQYGGRLPRVRSSGDKVSVNSSDSGVTICIEDISAIAWSTEDSDTSGEETGASSELSNLFIFTSAGGVSPGAPKINT